MSLITIDFRSRKLIYEQLIDNIKDLVISSQLRKEDTLPSVRALAKELGINPNTIQKAYAELERQGVIASYPGRGSVVIMGTTALSEIAKNDAVTELSAIAAKCASGGITEDEFISMCRAAWSADDGKNGGDSI